MKLNNGEIVVLYENLRQLGQKTLPVKTAFSIAKNIKTLEPYYSAIIETRDGILKAYGEFSKDGGVKVPSDKIQEANRDLSALQIIQTEINLDTISLSALEGNSWTIDEISGIYPIIDGEA